MHCAAFSRAARRLPRRSAGSSAPATRRAFSTAPAEPPPAAPAPAAPRPPRWSFHKRELQPPLVAFSSAEGRAMFARSLAAGTSDAYFPLSEQFMTQASPPSCGLTTLAMVLNAMNIDPNQRWKGGWRWFSEEMLLGNCCKPASEVEEDGMTMDDVAAVARCHGTAVEAVRATDVSLDAFREQVVASVASPAPPYLVATFSRSVLGQTGDGHFSPIAGYDAQSDHVLVLDVARFKYPPWYAPLPLLYEAMLPHDPVTQRPRGFLRVAPAEAARTEVGAQRDVPADGGGGASCPVAPIRKEYCPRVALPEARGGARSDYVRMRRERRAAAEQAHSARAE